MNKNNKVIDRYENALSVMTTQAYAMIEGGFDSADGLDFIFNVLDEHEMEIDVIPKRYEQDINIANIKARDLSGEKPLDKLTRLQDALYIMSNYICRMCKEVGSLDASDGVIAGILESNGIW